MAEHNASPISYQAGFVVLSYFISLAGCATTLELLQRRTSRKGTYNWYLLLASCISMGGIGIWCMHFIGNRAIVLQYGHGNRQINYNMGFTALSFFLPILVLFLAFYLLAVGGKARSVYIAVAGVLTGLAVCGMHYVGQLGIANYRYTYSTAYVVGSAVIAVAASLIALSIFFRLREAWTNAWWKRALCATLLAGAVSGMHWTAAIGTTYYYKGDSPKSKASRIQTVIVCAVLSITSCIVLLGIALFTSRKNRITRSRAQQLVLACAYFDDQGRLMLTPEGSLPCQKITDHFVERTFGEDELGRSHPTFIWVYKASRSWDVLYSLIPGIQTCLESDPTAWRYRPGNRHPVPSSADDLSTDFTLIFKQLFCMAAQNLATMIHEPLQKLGVLFEEPFETGTVVKKSTIPYINNWRKMSLFESQSDLEKNPEERFSFGKGKCLFLNRQLDRADVIKFAALGYRFGTISHVAETLSRSMQVSHDSMVSRLERMRLTSTEQHLPTPGIYLACFFCRPSVHKSFDVLVPANVQSQIPMTSLAVDGSDKSYQATLKTFDEWSLRSILKVLVNHSGGLELEKHFRWQLHSALARLIDMVGDSDIMMQARFCAKPIQIPCRTNIGNPNTSTCILYSFRVMGTIHTLSPRKELSFVPLSFFSAQQTIDSSATNREAFSRKMKREFGPGSHKTSPKSPNSFSFTMGRTSVSGRSNSIAAKGNKVDHSLEHPASSSAKHSPDPAKEVGGDGIATNLDSPRSDSTQSPTAEVWYPYPRSVPAVVTDARYDNDSIRRVNSEAQVSILAFDAADQRDSWVSGMFALFKS